MSDPIPQMFYVRKVVIGRADKPVTLFEFWNYRKSAHGSIKTKSKKVAMREIRKLFPEAEFFRQGGPRTKRIVKEPFQLHAVA